MYNPTIGRWMTRDPLQEAGGVNVYAFNNNDPINNIDPDGLAVIKYEPGREFNRGMGGVVNPTGDEFILNRPVLDAAGVPRSNIPIVRSSNPLVSDMVDLSPWSRGHVEIYFTGNNRIDQAAAIRAFNAKYQTKFDTRNLTFHHDALRMQKVTVEGIEMYLGRMEAVPRELNGSLHHEGSAAAGRQSQVAQGIDEMTYRAVAKAQNDAALKVLGPTLGPLERDSAESAVARVQGNRVTTRAFAGIGVYMTIRDAAAAAGINGMGLRELKANHYFTDDFGSVFTVQEIDRGIFRSNTYWRTIIAGYKAGRSEMISRENYDAYKEMAKKKYGEFIEGGLFSKPKFVPGTERKSIPWYDERFREQGWIDEDGPHQSPLYRPGIGTLEGA